MSEAKTTIDHDEIRKCVEARQGRPSLIKTFGKRGVLKIDLADAEEEFEGISWEDFFKMIDESDLAFLHQDKPRKNKPLQ